MDNNTPRTPGSPKISVLMAVYNAERYLQKAVDSILAQSFADFEFIVVDDGSTDGSLRILNAYQDVRLRLFHLKENRGLITALNLGLSQARGHYIARMDADDISLPHRFQRQVEWLDHHPETIVVGTGAIRIDSMDRPLENMVVPHRSSEDVGRYLTSGRCPLIHSSIMARTSVLQTLGGYRSQFPHSEDFDLWLRVLAVGQIFILSEPLIMYRSNKGSIRLTKIIEATHSHEYALDCYRHRAKGLPERARDEFLQATDLTCAEAQRFWTLALETLLLGDHNSTLTLITEVLRRTPAHSGAQVMYKLLSSPLPLPIAILYRYYRQVRGRIGISPVGPLLRDLKHRWNLRPKTHAF